MKPYQTLETWQVAKPVVRGKRGLIATQHYLASEAGADVLRNGGNAVDAIVTAGLVLGVVEPWMSGIGGGGFMQYLRAATGEVHGVDFAMRSPLSLDPADYPLEGGEGQADTFNWPTVLEDRHTRGPYSIAVPGYLAGARMALERYGTRTWSETVAPAVEAAEFGVPIDWFATLKIAGSAADLRRYAASRRVYLPDGLPPVGPISGIVDGLPNPALAATFRRLGVAGAEDLYTGELAAMLVEDSAETGAQISAADLAGYAAQPFVGESSRYRDAKVWAPVGLNAGPSLAQALGRLESRWSPGSARPDAAAYRAYASALLETYAERLRSLGAPAPSAADAGNTSHLSAVDAQGNIASWTQTIMSAFGSKVVFPGTGMTMNNGIMWFDPIPGRPNSIRPGVRPLSNMCPTIVERADGFRFAVGACGGRRIFPAVFQLISFLVDFRLPLEEAMHTPRIDVSGTDEVAADRRLPEPIASRLAEEFRVSRVEHGIYPNRFALPNVVGQLPDGELVGGAFVMSPTAKVAVA